MNFFKLFVLGAMFFTATFTFKVSAQSAYVNTAQAEMEPSKEIEQSKGNVKSTKQKIVEQVMVPFAPSAANNYAFTTATTGSLTDMSTGTTQLVAANQDDTASAVANIGFDFYFQGARFSQFSANSNGLIRLGGVAVQGSTPYKPLAQAGIPLITPYGADQRTLVTTGKVHFKVIGAAPNRVLVVEWLNMQANFNSGGTSDLTYQARLSESTGVIEFVYGGMTMSVAGAADVNSKDPNIGFSSSNVAGTVGSVSAAQSGTPIPTFDGTSATAVANLYTAGAITALTSAAQGSRRVFTFTPPTPTAPTSLTFSGVTGTAMTLNWVDSSNESLYAIYRSTDGVNYTFDGTAAQDAITYAAATLAPSTTYFWQVFAISEGGLSTALSGSQMTAPPGNISSTGAGGNWSDPAAWAGGVVPTPSDNVTIATGSTITIDTAATALSVTVNSGGSLVFDSATARTLTVGGDVTVASGGSLASAASGTVTTHVLSLTGNLMNNGTLDLSTNADTAGAGITFAAGVANVVFGGTGATTDVRTITVAKGAQARVVELNPTSFTVRGVNTDVAGYLTLTSGTFKISGTFTITNRTFTTAAYTIPVLAGIWLNNPNYTVAGTASSTTSGNSGLFRLSQGVYTIGLTAADGFDASTTTGVYVIEGGTLNANGRFDPQGTVNYTQTGGTINAAIVGNSRSSFGSFEIFGTASTFNMSGGTINIITPSSAATKDDFSMTGTTQNITGGQVVFGGPGAPATATYTTPFGTSNIPNVVVNPGMTWNINNVAVFFRGTTITNNGAIISTGTSARLDFANANAAMSYSGGGTLGTAVAPFGGVGISANSTQPITLNGPVVCNRVNLFQGGFINSNLITLGNGAASTTVVQTGSAGLLTPGGSFDVSPVHNQGTGGEILIYAQESATRTTGFEINPTRIVTSISVFDNTNNVILAGGDLTLSSAAAALALTNGQLITGGNTLILGSGTATVTRTNGYVRGNFRKTFAAAASKTFEVGDGGYSPVTANVTAGTFPATLAARAIDATLGGFDPAKSISRYWDLTEGGDITADLTFNYLAADLSGNEADYRVFRFDGANTNFCPAAPCVNTGTHTAGPATGVTAFSQWTVSEPIVIQPTASITGRVFASTGQGIRNAVVTVSGAGLVLPISTATTSFGYYTFTNLPTGNTYTVTVGARRFVFATTSHNILLNGDVNTGADFMANP